MSHSNDQLKYSCEAIRNPCGPNAEPGRPMHTFAPSYGTPRNAAFASESPSSSVGQCGEPSIETMPWAIAPNERCFPLPAIIIASHSPLVVSVVGRNVVAVLTQVTRSGSG